MTVVSEVYDASTALQQPPVPSTGEYLESIRDGAGLVLGRLDWVAEKLFGVSPIKIVVDPIAGDWTHLEVAAGGWESMGRALEATAANVGAGVDALGQIWQGEAAAAAATRLTDIAEMQASQSEACGILAEQCRTILEISQAAGEMVATGLSIISDILMELMAEMMVPLFGWAAATARAPFLATRFYGTLTKVGNAIKRIVNAINLAIRIIGTLQKVAAVATKLMSTATTYNEYKSAQLTDDAARVQFAG